MVHSERLTQPRGRIHRVSFAALAVALTAAALVAGGCKTELPSEDWARMQLGKRVEDVDLLERTLTEALEGYVAGAKTHEPGSRAALQQTLGRVLTSSRWITSWRPAVLVPADGAVPVELQVPITVPVAEQGGPQKMPGEKISEGRHLYWGLYRLGDDAYGGVEAVTTLRAGEARLRVHLIVIPNKPQLPQPD